MKGSFLCLLLALCAIRARAVAPGNVTIGVILPSTASTSRIMTAMQAAAEDHWFFLPGTRVNLVLNDSGGSVEKCNAAMHWQYETYKPMAWLGTTDYDLTVMLSGQATAYQRPLITYSAQTSTLTDRTRHPYVLRASAADDRTGDAMWAIIEHFGWKRVGIVHTNDDRGESLASCMKDTTPAGRRLQRFPFNPADQQSVIDVVDQLIEERLTVFILHGARTDIAPVLVRALEKGIMGRGYAWIGKDWGGTTQTTTYNGQTLKGVIMLSSSLQVETNAQALLFKEEMVRRRPDTTKESWTARDGAFYDAIIALMMSMNQLYDDPSLLALGEGPGLLKALMERVDFNGVSGHFKFTPSGDVLGMLDITTVSVDGKWTDVGHYIHALNRSAEVLNLTGQVIFGDGTTEPNLDYVQVYHDGDVMPYEWETFSQLLAFALSLIGTWTSLVLIEQAVAAFRVSKAKRDETPDYEGCCGIAWKFYLKRYEFLFWLFLAAFALGGVGIVCMGVVAFTGATLPEEAHGLRLDPLLATIAFPTTVVYCFIALLVELRDPNVAKPEEKKGAKPYLLKDQTTKGNYAAKLRTTFGRSWDELKQAVRAVSRWTVLFVFFLSLAIFASHYCFAVALSAEHGRLELDVSRLIPAIITALIFVSMASVLFFHVLKSKIRMFASPLLSLGILASQQIIMTNSKFLYMRHEEESAEEAEEEGHSVEFIQTIASAIGVAACFIFIGVQVTRLKLSRGALDRLLEQSQDQLHRLEHQVAEEKVAKQYAQSECNEAKNMLELINFARPLFRNHALAHALADRRGAGLGKETGTRDDGERGQGQVSIWALGLAAAKNERTVAALLAELNAMPSLHSGPVNDRAHNDVKLTELLSHPVTLEILKDTVMRSLAPESVALLLDIQRYRSVDRSSLRLALAQELVNCYILPDAPYCVNISSTMRNQLQVAVRTGRVTGATFDEVETELLKLISTNTMDQFYTSTAFKICCLLLEHPAYRLKTNIRRGVQGAGGPGSSHSSSNPKSGAPVRSKHSKNSSKESSKAQASSLPSPSSPHPVGRKRQVSQSGTNATHRTLGAEQEPPSPVHPVSLAWGTPNAAHETDGPSRHLGTTAPQGSSRRLMHKPPDRDLPKSNSNEQKLNAPLHAHNMSMVLDGEVAIPVAPEDDSGASTESQPSS